MQLNVQVVAIEVVVSAVLIIVAVPGPQVGSLVGSATGEQSSESRTRHSSSCGGEVVVVAVVVVMVVLLLRDVMRTLTVSLLLNFNHAALAAACSPPLYQLETAAQRHADPQPVAGQGRSLRPGRRSLCTTKRMLEPR